MMQARWTNRIGLAGAVRAGRARCWEPAAGAQDDSVEQNSIWNLEQRVWGGIVRGLGLRDPNAPAIDYRERSPLVVPPSRDLPPPQAKASPKNPAWPSDPDVARARKAGRQEKAQHRQRSSTALEKQGRPISPDELNKGSVTGSVPSNRSNAPASGRRTGARSRLPNSAILAGCSRAAPGASAHTRRKPGPSPASRRGASSPSHRPATRRRPLPSPMA